MILCLSVSGMYTRITSAFIYIPDSVHVTVHKVFVLGGLVENCLGYTTPVKALCWERWVDVVLTYFIPLVL